MRERRGISFSVVARVVLTVVLGVASAPGQPTSTAAVDVTFPDTSGTLQLPGQLYRPDGPDPRQTNVQNSRWDQRRADPLYVFILRR